MSNKQTLLKGVTVVTIAINLPGPATAERLCEFGANVIKVEPPVGDQMEDLCKPFYDEMADGQTIVRLNIKSEEGIKQLHQYLESADLFITSNRPAALQRLGLDWESLHAKYPKLCFTEIVGFPAPRDHIPGHDLNYQAELGLATPPFMPRSLIADLAGAEQAISTSLALLFARDHGQEAGHQQVALSTGVAQFARPYQYGLTKDGAVLGGALPNYRMYETKQGWIATGTLEPHFEEGFRKGLELDKLTIEAVQEKMLTRTAEEWEKWGEERDLPINKVQGI